MNIKEDYNLRENADIVALAMDCAKSLNSTELKAWFERKYQDYYSKSKFNDDKKYIARCHIILPGGSVAEEGTILTGKEWSTKLVQHVEPTSWSRMFEVVYEETKD